MKAIFILTINLILICIADADDNAPSLRQQLSDAIASGRKMDFGDEQHKTAIQFRAFPDNDSKRPSVEPLFYSVGKRIALRGGREESIKECRDRITSWCVLCRKNDLIPTIQIYIHYEHEESLLKSVLDAIANEGVQEVWMYIMTKEDVFRYNKVDLPLPRPLPTPPSKQEK